MTRNVSAWVRNYIDSTPTVAECMLRGIISHPGLAQELQPKIEHDLGQKVKPTAIIMALRRYEETLTKTILPKERVRLASQLQIKTNLCVLVLLKTPDLAKKVNSLYPLVNFSQGDTLNIILGNLTISIIADEKYAQKIKTLLAPATVVNEKRGLVALNILFAKSYVQTPGMIYLVVRTLAWHRINIFELLSSHNELSLLLSKQDAAKAYGYLEHLMYEKEE
ncbi:MAG: hypothetical protein QW594_03750 [Candidatus Woesearchaeota archaeon]